MGNNLSGFTGILGGVTDIISNVINANAQKDINAQNLENAERLTREQWARDDETYQRSIKDATEAGFSPLAVLQGGTIGSSTAVNSQAIAPKTDLSGLITSLISASELLDKKEQREHESEENEKNREQQNKLSDKELTFRLEEQEKELNQEFKLKTAELNQQYQQMLTDINKTNANLAIQAETLNMQNYAKKQERLMQLSESSYKNAENFFKTYGVNLPYQIYTSQDAYKNATYIFNAQWKEIQSEIRDITSKTPDATSRGAGAGINGGEIGLNANANESQTNTTDIKAQISKLLASKNIYCPIFQPYGDYETNFKTPKVNEPK